MVSRVLAERIREREEIIAQPHRVAHAAEGGMGPEVDRELAHAVEKSGRQTVTR